MGMRLAQRVNGVSRLHGEVSREMFGGLWPGFDTAQVPIGSVTNGVHAPTWVAQEVLDLASATPEDSAVAQQLPEDGHAWERVAHTAPARLWEIRRALRGRLVCAGPGAAAGVLAAARRQRRGAGLDRWGTRRERADDRVRPPGAVLQAAHADPARPGPADRADARPRAASAVHHRGQGPPGRRRRQAADPADGPVRRRPRGAAPHRVPARLRHGHGPRPGAGLRRVAEQPAAPAGGVRYFRHEVGAERRAQPVHPGRLVGRVVRRRRRLGDPVRGRRGGYGAARRARVQRAL